MAQNDSKAPARRRVRGRQLALKALATLVNVKGIAADRILRPARILMNALHSRQGRDNQRTAHKAPGRSPDLRQAGRVTAETTQ